MSAAHARFGVRHSALGWLRRLGWNHLDQSELAPLRGVPESTLLEMRLLPWLRRFRFQWNGEQQALSAASVEQIIACADTCCHSLDWEASSAAVHRLLVEGVRIEQLLPDGSRITVRVPLIDWEHVHRNHWDVADAVSLPDLREPDIRELVCYVNGVPLVVVACVERDRERRWGSTAAAIERFCQSSSSGLADSAALHAQLLLCLDRRGGCYASVGTPAHAWMRWREHGWSPAAQARLRDTPAPFAGVPLDPPWSVHAELLYGVLRPDRVLQLLRGFLYAGTRVRRQVARPCQFFAVQNALRALRTRDAEGRRGGGQLCLAAGSGLGRARYWLVHALRSEPAFHGLRILMPVTRPASAQPERKRRPGPAPGDQLTEFLAGHGGPTLEIPLRALRGWARRAALPATAEATHRDILLLVDADFWETQPALLRRLRRCLPQATWMTVCAQPIVLPATDLAPGPLLYQYAPAQAAADGVIVPTWRDGGPIFPEPARDADSAAVGTGPDQRQARVAAAIGQHFHGLIRVAERDLRGALLVDTAKEAQNYQRALSDEQGLRTQVSGYDGQGKAMERAGEHIAPQIEVLIAHGDLPALQDPRLGLLYVDRPLSAPERLRAVGLINAPHPDKRAALVVDFHASGMTDAPGQAWLPPPTAAVRAALAAEHRRLQGLLPLDADQDFHACCDQLAPAWALGPHGEDVDLHRRRRDLLHQRVTAFGQRLQVAMASEASFTGEQAAVAARYRTTLHRYSVLRDAVSRLALEQGRFNAEDLRTRHWARERAPEVREEAFSYGLLDAAEPPVPTAAQQANQAYTQLRHRLATMGDPPRRVEQTRHALSRILAYPDARTRLEALQRFEDMLLTSSSSGNHAGSPSRGLSLLDGLFGGTQNLTGDILTGALIDTVVAEAHRGPLNLFDHHVRGTLEPLLRGHLEEFQVQAVLQAVLSCAKDWPPD